jgi:hypothetical protein
MKLISIGRSPSKMRFFFFSKKILLAQKSTIIYKLEHKIKTINENNILIL